MGSTAVSDQPQPPQLQSKAPTPSSRTISPSPSRTLREGSTFSSPSKSRRIVVTAPPWASHEQPVPDEELLSPTSALTNGPKQYSNSSHERMPSDIASFTSSQEPPHTGNWWTFTGTRNDKVVVEDPAETEDTSSPEGSEDLERGTRPTRLQKPRPSMKQRNPSAWIGAALSAVNSRKKGKTLEGANEGSGDEEGVAEEEDQPRQKPSDLEEVAEESDYFNEAGPSTPVKPVKPRFRKRMLPRRASSNILRLDLPLPPAPLTKAQTETPGWDSPWNPRKYLQEPLRAYSRDGARPVKEATDVSRIRSHRQSESTSPDMLGSHIEKHETGTPWTRRMRTLRTWALQNIYVPLLFRILNLAFTSATLGVAIGIRRTETRYDVLGVLGPSATITIIFAPITLVHVIISIYLEYFGRPIGLWKTSSKLTLTLVEIVLVCAWSSSLAICYNDYVTTALGCGPRFIDRWWSNLPAPESPLSAQQQANGADREMCEQQAALISMAFVTLMSYCSNLVISLFRIIEKVKSYSTHKRVNWP